MSKKLSETINSWLLANGYNSEDLNQPGNKGDTALMKATREGAVMNKLKIKRLKFRRFV